VKHGALLDAELLAQVYVELTGGRQIGLELVDDARGSGAGDNAPWHRPAVSRQRREPRPHAAYPEERARWEAFLAAEVKEALWTR